MAVKKTTTTARKNSFMKEAEPVVENTKPETVESVEAEETVEEKAPMVTSKKTVKKFNPDDLILCQSMCVGQTFVKGFKSGTIYTFEALGAEEYIEYRDLVAAVRSKDNIIFKPFIIVLDEDFINEQKTLKTFYDNMYTPEDFEEFFKLRPNQMVEALNNMPIGVRDTIKSMAVGRIQDGTFDSVTRIKALDDYFGTKMMLLTELYGED